MLAQSRSMEPAAQRERSDTYLAVKPRLVSQKVTTYFGVRNIMEGVMFFTSLS